MQELIDAFVIGAVTSLFFGIVCFIFKVFKKPEEKWKLYVQNIILGILIGLCAIVSISMLIVAITDFEFIGLMLLALLVDIPIVIFAVIRLRKNLNLLKNNSFKK